MASNLWEVPWERARKTYQESDITPSHGPVVGLVGQERAERAVDFALAISAHLFLVGPAGTGKRTFIQRKLRGWAASRPTPQDWCYVPQFDRENEPEAVALGPGRARHFQRDVEEFVHRLYETLRDAFDAESYAHHRQSLLQEFETKQSHLWQELSDQARQLGFSIQTAPTGQILTAPLRPDGQPFRAEEFEGLPARLKETMKAHQAQLQEPMQLMLHRMRTLDREARQAVVRLDHEVAHNAAAHLIETYAAPYQESKASQYFSQILENALRYLDELRRDNQDDSTLWAGRYAVRVIVEHAAGSGAPVILETNPSFAKLFGQIHYTQVQGTMLAGLGGIVAGSVLNANGGYLVLMAEDLLAEPYAYGTLKRVLREGAVKVENAPEAINWMRPSIFQPQPIPLNLTIVLIGSASAYYALYNGDPDFRRLFTVKADFAPDMLSTEDSRSQLVRILYDAVPSAMSLSPGAAARLLEFAAELSEDQDRLSTRVGELLAVMKEAEVWARGEAGGIIEKGDVEAAMEARRDRSAGPADLMQRLILDGTLLIATEGIQVGQVNGLAVLSAGDAPFGHPSRITARVWAGERGIVNIERQTRQSGVTHSKGVLTLIGFFSGRFGTDRQLALSASIGFEQMYDAVDGDSASSAELYALLSALSGIGIAQGIAVTGSVDQYGRVQPIGGVNQKIAGFFRACQSRGLSGKEGVMIPSANRRNLMVPGEVQAALRSGMFHVWAVDTVDQGIEILTGIPAGVPSDEPSTVMGSVAARLQAFAEVLNTIPAHSHPADTAPS